MDISEISSLRTQFGHSKKIISNFTSFQEWNDMNLRWNASEFGGVKDLRIPPHRLWKPDVLMYNR